MNNDLFKAILAMDSYNRGYSAGIDLNKYDSEGNILNSNGTKLGGVTILGDSSLALGEVAQQDGFYAIAYQYAKRILSLCHITPRCIH